jgi:hypothetical protein
LTSYRSSFALFCACCVVVEFHSSHSLAIFQWIFSSFSWYFAKIRQVSNSRISVRFVSQLLCCCWVSLQPQLRLRLRLRQLQATSPFYF